MPDASFQPSAYPLPSNMNYNAFLGLNPSAASLYPPVYTPSVSSNVPPNSFMPVYAPNISGNSVAQSFSSGYAPPMTTDAFTSVYASSMSASSFSFADAMHHMSWDNPMFHTSPNTTKWLQAQLTQFLQDIPASYLNPVWTRSQYYLILLLMVHPTIVPLPPLSPVRNLSLQRLPQSSKRVMATILSHSHLPILHQLITWLQALPT